MTKIILFEIHATSIDNERKIASGHLDPQLSEKGKKQAQNLGQRYKNSKISTVYCSDLLRSYETAELAFNSRKLPIIKDRRLREWNYGNFNGSPVTEIETMKPSYINKPFPGGESLLEAVERISDFIQKLDISPIMIVGHRAVYYTLENLFNKIPLG